MTMTAAENFAIASGPVRAAWDLLIARAQARADALGAEDSSTYGVTYWHANGELHGAAQMLAIVTGLDPREIMRVVTAHVAAARPGTAR